MSDEERARLIVTSELWHDRDHIQRLIGASLYLARAEEREACARIGETEYLRSPDGRFGMTDHPSYVMAEIEKSIAAAIRGRE